MPLLLLQLPSPWPQHSADVLEVVEHSEPADAVGAANGFGCWFLVTSVNFTDIWVALRADDVVAAVSSWAWKMLIRCLSKGTSLIDRLIDQLINWLITLFFFTDFINKYWLIHLICSFYFIFYDMTCLLCFGISSDQTCLWCSFGF